MTEKPFFSQFLLSLMKAIGWLFYGKNGIGKSSILKLILKENIEHTGELKVVNGLKISYVSQKTDGLKGSLKAFAKESNVEESIFKAMLTKMGLTQDDFETNIEDMSDILSREQIEDCILAYQPTLIFVEHDERFTQKIATKVVNIEK